MHESMRIRSSRKWLKSIRKKFRRSSHSRDIVYSYTVPSPNEEELIIYDEEEDQQPQAPNGNHHHQLENSLFKGKQQDAAVILAAAIKIQATFRAHLARRAFKALRSLVKLQALARGAYVRKQTQLALHCMHALVRLQVRIRTRQLLLGSFDV